MTFEEKTALAFAETAEERTAQFLTMEKTHKFSLAYRLWERRTLKNLAKNRINARWTLRRAKYAVVSLLAAAFVLLGTTVYAVGITIGRYGFDTKPDYSRLLIEKADTDKTVIEEYYELSDESGVKVIDCFQDEMMSVINYELDNKKITFSQMTIMGNMGNLNTENAVIEPISVYEENDGFFIIFQENGGCGLYWIYNGYLFNILGNITKKEALDLAHSTKIVQI